jgi:hypothetical protein
VIIDKWLTASHHKNIPHTIRKKLRGIIILLVFVTACTTAENMLPKLTGNIPINAPSTASAGSDINVSVGPLNVANGTPIGLVMVGVRGPKVYNTVFTNGEAHFRIPSTDTYQLGYVALIVASQDARGEASIIVSSPRRSNIYNITQVETTAQ